MRLAEEPLSKITINIFTSDYEYLRTARGWQEEVRNIIRNHIRTTKRQAMDRIARSQIEDPDHD